MRFVAIAVLAGLFFGFAAVAPCQDSRDDEYLIRGLIRDGLIEVAADRIFDFVFKYPDNPRSERMLYDINRSLMDAGKVQKAVPLLRCYLQEFPQGQWRHEVNLMLGRALVAQQEQSQAIPLLSAIIDDINQRTDDRLEAKELLAGIYLSQGRFEEARVLLEETSPKGTSPRIRLILAGSLRGLRQYQQAEEILKSLIARKRRDDVWDAARRDLVDLYLESARYQDIVQVLGDLTPPPDGVLPAAERPMALALAISHYHLGSFEAAWNWVSLLRGTTAPSIDSSKQLPAVLVSLGEWSSAAQVLEGYYQRQPDTVRKLEIGWQLLDALRQSFQNSRVIAVAEEMAQITSNIDERHRLYRFALDVAFEPAQRATLLEHAIAAVDDPACQAEFYHDRGELLAGAGDRAGAIAAFDQCRTLDPEGIPAVQANLKQGELLTAADHYAEAQPFLQSVVAALPGSAEADQARRLQVRCLVGLRQWHEALVLAESIFSGGLMQPGDEELYRLVALAAQTDGSFAAAADFTRRAILSNTLGSDDEAVLLLREADSLFAESRMDDAEPIYEVLSQDEDAAVRDAANVGLVAIAMSAADWTTAITRCTALHENASVAWLGDWAAFTAAQCRGKNGDLRGEMMALQDLLAAAPSGPYADAAVTRLQEIALAANDYGAALQADPVFVLYSPPSLVATDRNLALAQRNALQGQYEAAVKLYEVVPSPEYLSLVHRYYYALSLHRTGRLARALPILEKMQEKELILPWRQERTRMIADALLARGDAATAMLNYRSLLAQSLSADLRYAILPSAARCAEAGGDWPEADKLLREYLETAKERGESDVDETKRIAELYASHGEYARAIELYRQIEVLVTAPEKTILISFRIAELIRAQSGPEAAAEEYLTIAYRNPGLGVWPARARLKAAEIFGKAGMRDLAERQYRTVAEQFAGTDEGQVAVQRLREMMADREKIEEEQLQNP